MGGCNLSKKVDGLPKEVTQVIRRNIIPGDEKQYDDWLRKFMAALRSVPGYLSTTVIVPNENPNSRYIVHRFTDETSMDNWEQSDVRHNLLEEVNQYSTPHYEKATGLETWFAVPDMNAIVPPAKWKMAIVTYPGAYVLSTIAFFALHSNPVTANWPFLVGNVIINAIIVLGLTYFVMPTLSQIMRRWLYPSAITN